MKHDQGQSCIQIRDIGSFFVGGRIATLTGQPQRRVRVARNGPDRMVDLNGDYVTGQCYVHYVRQAAPKFDAPMMFWHGGAMTGATWETTPDGRPGWQSFFLRQGFDTYVCDAVERGRSGWSPYPEIYDNPPIFRTQKEAWSLFRFGNGADYGRRKPFEGQRFPVSKFDRFGMQLVPRWTDHGQLSLEAYYLALEQVGPVWLVAHSQGGNFALESAAKHPELFKGVIVIEPASAPEDIGQAASVPHLFLWGDNITKSPLWMSYRNVVDDYVARLIATGGDVSVFDLPQQGIHGNSHIPMMDDNSDTVAWHLLKWIERTISIPNLQTRSSGTQ